MTPKELLSKTNVFSSLQDATLKQISERLTREEFSQKQHLMEKGQVGNALYIIESGLVGIYVRDSDFGHDIEIAQLGPGECIGELALITGESRSATVTALMKTSAYRLDRKVFEAIVTQSPKVQLELIKTLSRRLSAASARQGIPFISLARYEPDPILIEMVPEKLIITHSIVPVAFEDGAILLATVDPGNMRGMEDVRRFLKNVVTKPVAVSREDFERFMAKLQSVSDVRNSQIPQIPESDVRYLIDSDDVDRSHAVSGKEVLDIVSRIIATGIQERASDIHVEPQAEGTRVRYRIHGSLEEKFEPFRLEAHKPLISRFKVLAKLDITENRKPQEGRISVEVGKRAVDLRLSLIPTKLGQKLVIRILDATMALVPLEELVVSDSVREVVRNMFYAPHGVVLVTGPTGSGKTTTMYSALLERRKPEINIVTVEDPIEFHLDGLSQVEVGGNTGVDFAAVLRSFLRQDPDIILVGETRDAETAKLALQAGLTGRLVFSSFHTNDCISSVVRLMEMGMEPFALGNALVGVIHQRLVRRLCPSCRAPYEYHSQMIENLRSARVIGDKVPTLYRSKGCTRCNGQGYTGRISALEVMTVTDKIRNAISAQESPEKILACATRESFMPLTTYAHFLLTKGYTAPGEILGALPKKGLDPS